jgi:hypothetical protein
MNFGRGHQMIIHDPRLNNPTTTPPTLLRPPAAYNVWTVQPTHSPQHIIEWAATVGTTSGGLDALHLMAHGNRAYMEIGSGSFGWHNVELFRQLSGKTRFISFLSCLVGSDESSAYRHPPMFGHRVAELSGANVLVCRENQQYSWSAAGVLDFGAFEGEVYVYTPGSTYNVYNSYNPFRATPQIDLEAQIFS